MSSDITDYFLLRSLPKLTLPVDLCRFKRALSQSFHIVSPHRFIYDREVIILGSTGNEYVVMFSLKSILCNCPDEHKACKHILFILHALRILKINSDHVTTIPSKILPLIWRQPPLPSVKPFLLDHHTNILCSQHLYPPCYFCSNNSYGSIILCSKCGLLGHKACFMSTCDLGSNCPKCGRVFYALQSNVHHGYRNYLNVLNHFDYLTSSIEQVTFQSASRARKLKSSQNNNVQHDFLRKPHGPVDDVPPLYADPDDQLPREHVLPHVRMAPLLLAHFIPPSPKRKELSDSSPTTNKCRDV